MRRFVIASSILAIAFAVAAAPAGAARNKTLNCPNQSCVPVQMNLGSGPVVAGAVTVHAIFWESHAVDQPYDNYLTRFLTDLNGSSLMNLLHSYIGPDLGASGTGAPGPSVALVTWSDKRTPLPTAHIGSTQSEADIQNEVRHAIAQKEWATTPGNVFMVFTGPGYQAGARAGECGEHESYFEAPTGNVVPYAFVPRPGIGLPVLGGTCVSPHGTFPINPTPSGSVRQDAAVSTAWHELAEMLTDPVGTSYFDPTTGNEIGDGCLDTYPAVTGADNHNVTLNGHDYLVQGIWSRPAGGCVVAPPPDLGSDWTPFNFGAAPTTALMFTVNAGRGGATLEVSDAFCQGDRFEVWDNGVDLGPTSYVANTGCDGPDTSSPTAAFADGGWSAGTWFLPSGRQQISLQVIQDAVGESGGEAFYASSAPITSVTGQGDGGLGSF